MAMLDLDLGQQKAEELVEKLPQYEPSLTPTPDIQEGVRAVGTMANLALFYWDALHQLSAKGIEGGRAKALLEKAMLTLSIWRTNIQIAIRPVEHWHEKVAFAFSLDELRNLDKRLGDAYGSAEQLLKLVSSQPPDLPQEIREKLKGVGREDDSTPYLDSETFLARMRP
jgi:hypothetical protein